MTSNELPYDEKPREFGIVLFNSSRLRISGFLLDVAHATRLFLKGFIDSLRVDYLLQELRKNPKVRTVIISCVLLNLCYIGMVLGVEHVLLPLTASIAEAFATTDGERMLVYWCNLVLSSILWIVYFVTWLLSMFIFSFLRSNKWYSDLAEILPPPIAPRKTNHSKTLVVMITDELIFFSQILVFKTANLLITFIPYTGWWLSFVLQCLLASSYAFECHWLRSGKPRSDFIPFMERDWAYFLGFGATVTAITMPFSVFVSLALYAAILPLFIVVAGNSAASAWRSSTDRYKFDVLPSSINYFDLGQKGTDLAAGLLLRSLRIKKS